MFIEETVSQFYMHTKQYRLSVAYVEVLRKGNVHGAKLKLVLDSKINNINPQKLTGQICNDEQQLKSFYRKLASSRLYIHRFFPRLTVLQECSIMLKDTTSTFTQKEIETADVVINYGRKYWKSGDCQGCIYWPVHITILRKNHKEVTIGQVDNYQLEQEISKYRKNKDKEGSKKKVKEKKGEICRELSKIVKEKKFTIGLHISIFRTSSKLIPLLPINTLSIKKSQQPLTERQKLFRHIFLTELVAHMIINQFGRNKRKQEKYRDGRIPYDYEDYYLQALRSCGHRFSEFRDHSVESFHSPEQDLSSDSSQSEKLYQSDSEYEDKKENKKSEVQKVGKKIKRVFKNTFSQKAGEIQNLIFINGEDKSKINKKRYCLHQMGRETDKTQSLINFIQLVFEAYWPKEQLFSHNGESYLSKKRRISYFLQKVKVKRCINASLEEYTRQSFFHKILNIGLRTLNKPHELTYLRFPFSHIFWSIRTLYHQHKKSIFHDEKMKNQKRVMKMYRGCKISEEQLKKMKQNVGDFIEFQGFLSTTLSEDLAFNFAINVTFQMVVPVTNLKGMYDNGFARISTFSEHPNEREVLFNAFNIFKIISLQIKTKNNFECYEITVEYGGIKQIEDKVRKSENLLESQFLMKVQEEKIQSVKHLLHMKEEKMTPVEVEKLRKALTEEEVKLKKWKDTLRKQEKREYKAAYKKLSKWEQELLDNYCYQQNTLKNIDNYGQLLVLCGEYKRGAAYCERMIKQVERDRAMEGWQWTKTPCVINRQETYRLLLAQCYSRQYRLEEESVQLQKVKQLYLCTNITPSSYIQLLRQLQHTYQQLQYKGYSDQYEQISLEVQKVCQQHNIAKPIEQVIDNVHNIWGVEDKLLSLKGGKLKGRIKQQGLKLKHMSNNTEGKYSINYLSQLHILIYLLFLRETNEKQKQSSLREVMKEGMRYLSIREQSQLENRSATINVFFILLWTIEKSTEKQKWVRLVCKHLQACLTSYLYHEYEIQAIYLALRLCANHQLWRNVEYLLLQLAKLKISCLISSVSYDQMVMIFVYACSIRKSLMEWVRNTERRVHDFHQEYRRKIGLKTKQFVEFPDSIAYMQSQEYFSSTLDYIQIDYRHVINQCKVVCLSNSSACRELQYSQQVIRKHIRAYHLQQKYYSKPPSTELKRVWGRGASQLVTWHKPCLTQNIKLRRDGIDKHLTTGECMMAMQCTHQHYLRQISSISQLHFPRYGYLQRNPPSLYAQARGESTRIRSMQRRLDHIKQQRKYMNEGTINGVGIRMEKQTTIIVQQEKHEGEKKQWRQMQAQIENKVQLFQLQGEIEQIQMHTTSLYKAKQYCRSLVQDCASIPLQRVVGLWEGHIQVYVSKQLRTIKQLHLKMLSSSQCSEVGASISLAYLIKEELYKQIYQLDMEEYLIPILKGLVDNHCVLPRQLMRGLLEEEETSKQLLNLLWSEQPLRQSLKKEIQIRDASKVLLQSPKEMGKYFDFSLEEYFEDESRKEKRHCTRQSVLATLIKQQQHKSLKKLFSPVIRYSQIKQNENRSKVMKDAFDAFVKLIVLTKSYPHDSQLWTS